MILKVCLVGHIGPTNRTVIRVNGPEVSSTESRAEATDSPCA